MADMQKVLDALARLDHDNDDQWLSDGTPKLSAVQKLANDQTIKRRDIEAAAIKRENPLRDDMIRNVVSERAGEPITVENLARFFPDDFCLCDYDLAPYIDGAPAEQPIEFEGAEPTPAPEAEAFNHPLPVSGNEAEQAPEPPPPTPEQIDKAVQRRIKADQDLANMRVLQLTEDDKERELRTALAKAVHTFQSGFPPINPALARKQHAQEQVQIRQAIKDGLLPGPEQNVPRGAVSRAAYYRRFGHGPRTGGGGAYASRMVKSVDGKGPMQTAYPSQAYGRKVPSEV
jgi:hypothetical protein